MALVATSFTEGASSSSSSSPPLWNYDVFVSFRGEDTRTRFTDHLCSALDQKGILTFQDDKKLERGKPISPELIRAIEGSKISIVVFSRNYASSSWCLDELAKIVECMELAGQMVLPIFYDVDPSDVRSQKGSFQEAFVRHEEKYSEKVQKWRAALTKVANLSGWDLKQRNESPFIQDIVREILRKLSKLQRTLSSVSKDLIGIESRFEEITSHLSLESDDVRFIGIWGMGGIGKTTLASVAYEMFLHEFEGCSFVGNVREVADKRGLFSLQEQLLAETLTEKSINIYDVYKGVNEIRNRLRYKKVLVILDDVDTQDQLLALAGEHNWFGPGSRVIITTRDEHLLVTHGVDTIYEARELNDDESLQLLSRKAFKQDHPTQDFMRMSKQIVSYSSRLPLALAVLGSFLYGRSISEWGSALQRLESTPREKIFEVLRISYDGLEKIDKNIFLDIACFFRQSQKKRVIELLDSWDFFSEIGISVLLERCFITITSGMIFMHTLVQEMAWSIVREQSLKEPGKRSRLWLYQDIHHVLTKNTGSEDVEAIVMRSTDGKEMHVPADAFSMMNNLRMLKLHDVNPTGELDFLSNELRVLKWNGYPLKSLPHSFKPDKLFELKLSHSRIEQLWNGVVPLGKLKFLKLSHSKCLAKTPDFSGLLNLEKLTLEGCINLYEIHNSIGKLTKLVFLNLKDCRKLSCLPSTIGGLQSLRVLHLCGCLKLDRLPDSIGALELLEELDLADTGMWKSPSSIVALKNLKKLSFRGCRGQPVNPWNLFLRCLLPGMAEKSMSLVLPSSFSGMTSLSELNLSDCNLSEGAIPDDIGQLSSLKKLYLKRNNFVTLPASISQLSQLQTLRVEYCHRLQELPALPPFVEDLCTDNCSSLTTLVATRVGLNQSRTREFVLNNCFKLVEIHGNGLLLDILRMHLYALMKARILSWLCSFHLWCSKQVNNNLILTLMEGCFSILIPNLLQEISDPPPSIPDLFVFIPGSEIPDWFTHQRSASSISMNMPPNWFNNNLIMGLAVCAVFQVQDHPTVTDPSSYIYKFSFYLVVEDDRFIIKGIQRPFSRDTLAVANHQSLLFIPFDDYLETCNWPEIKAIFNLEGPGIELKNVGLRLVYLQDALELNQGGMEQGVSSGLLQIISASHVISRSDDQLPPVDLTRVDNNLVTVAQHMITLRSNTATE